MALWGIAASQSALEGERNGLKEERRKGSGEMRDTMSGQRRERERERGVNKVS